jgi:extracellular factor (EF) 3-hydroxypalmitic acid methyl ester biosynthesis protein
MTTPRHLPDQAFPFLTLAERDRLLKYGRRQCFEMDDVILREDHRSCAVYVLLSGRVAVAKDHLDECVVLDELRPGAVFGEVSFLDGSPPTASIVALEPVELFVLDELDELLTSDPPLASGFYRSLATLVARRLRFTTNESVRAAAAWV